MNISLFYKNATVLDYAFLDSHLGVVGGALKVNVEFIGHTDDEGVVYDFSYAKKKVKEVIDRDCDHRLVVPKGLIEELNNNYIQLKFPYGLYDEMITYECPKEGICEIPFAHVSKQTLETYLEEIIMKEMPNTVDAVKIELEEEEIPKEKGFFRYTHGLKEHYGNCQRLFHGHQNTVDVFINGERSLEMENYLARDLFKGNVHFCKWENVVNKEVILKACGETYPEGRYDELPTVEIAYESSQGVFKGTLPGRSVYFLQEESTVENLSMHFAKVAKSFVGESDIVKVCAYEGIAKGAITTL